MIVNSLIGEGSEFRGEFKVRDLIRIDGYFKGNIITEGKVLVGRNGVVDTDIRADVVVVGGEVRGSINARKRVTLLSTCCLYGDIVTCSLLVEEGGIFKGHCTINQHTSKKQDKNKN